jgi:uncharacterized repeat protein (TIGR04138 family)
MFDIKFVQSVEKILKEDSRFSPEAYDFVAKTVSFTVQAFEKKERQKRHITGRELINGLLALSSSEYGPLAYEVLSGWGIEKDRDVGQIVFNMIKHQLLSKNENDNLSDFDAGIDLKKEISNHFSTPEPKKHPDIIIE